VSGPITHWPTRRYALVFALLAACGSTAVIEQDSGAPVGDASLPAVDGGGADRADVAVDAAPRPDSGVHPPGSWRPFPGAPTRCGMELSESPEVSAPHMEWKDCASPAECRYLKENWRVTKITRQVIITRQAEHIFVANGKMYAHYLRLLDDGVGFALEVVEEVGVGTVYAAYVPNDPDESCAAGLTASANGIGSFAFSQTASNTEQIDYWAGWSALASPLAISTRAISPSETGIGKTAVSGSLSFGPNALHMEAAGLSLTRVFTLNTTTKALSYASNNPPVMGTELPRWTPTGVMVLGDQAPYSLRFMPVGGGNTVVAAPSAGYNVTFAGLDRARSNALVWLETQEGAVDRKNLTVYTSPYAENAAGLVRRQVAKLPDPNAATGTFFDGFVVNAGMLLTVTSSSNLRLMRLSDGMGWNIGLRGPATGYTEALYVDDDNIYVGMDAVSGAARNQNGIVQIPRASLGEPTIPNGL
jgi:hypothetical protein